MKKDFSIYRFTRELQRFFLYFLLMAGAATTNILVFVYTIQIDMHLYENMLRTNAKITFYNILLLTVLFYLFDIVRRKITVERPVSCILEAMDQIMQGDFHVRVNPIHGELGKNEFDEIIHRLNKMTEELAGVEIMRTDFVSNVSHELKTPLAVIQNYGTMLQQPGLPEETRILYAKNITQSTRNLAALITNILKLNRLENQQIFPEKKSYNLSEQICECLLAFEDAWEKKELEIETEIQEDIMVNEDAELLSLVWNNLFSNAVKFTEQGGKISVLVRKIDAIVAVEVADTGCGMDSETGKHIFEKFYQGDTSHSTQGNGLGLALVKRVVSIVGGNIFVKSELGKGSTFTVTLHGETDIGEG